LPKENLTQFDLDEQFKEKNPSRKNNYIRINKNFGSVFDEQAYKKSHNIKLESNVSNRTLTKSIEKVHNEKNSFKTSNIFKPNFANTGMRYSETYNSSFKRN